MNAELPVSSIRAMEIVVRFTGQVVITGVDDPADGDAPSHLA